MTIYLFNFTQLRSRCQQLLIISLLTLLLAGHCSAHMLNMTRMEVNVLESGQTDIQLEIDLGQSLMSAEQYWQAVNAIGLDRERLLRPALERLAQDISFTVGGTALQTKLIDSQIGATSLEAIMNPMTPQMATFRYRAQTQLSGDLQVQISEDLEVPWPFLVRVDIADRDLPVSRLLTDTDRSTRPVSLSAGAQNRSEAGAFLLERWRLIAPELTWVAVGFTHIIPKGLDHILFILGLFFLAGGLRTLLLQVTGFTLAHSITLGLATYGVVSVPATIVEPLIALSIVYVAVDNLFSKQLARWRLLVVCLFGLLHGLGFASVLADIGLPDGEFLLSLALFNIGVELGQISILLAAFMIVGWFRRQQWYEPLIAHPATVAIAGTGAYWFFKRIAF